MYAIIVHLIWTSNGEPNYQALYPPIDCASYITAILSGNTIKSIPVKLRVDLPIQYRQRPRMNTIMHVPRLGTRTILRHRGIQEAELSYNLHQMLNSSVRRFHPVLPTTLQIFITRLDEFMSDFLIIKVSQPP